MKKIAYITINTPYGSRETFILTEMLALKEKGAEILVLPRDRVCGLFHEKARVLLGNTISLPRLHGRFIAEFLRYFFRQPGLVAGLIRDVALKARNITVAAKNMIVLPKALYLSRLLENAAVSHIHAHWASTPATIAYIMSRIMHVPWSFTAHRWDIAENNLLAEKCRSASFVRAISDSGRQELIRLTKSPALAGKVCVIHMGVSDPPGAAMVFDEKKVFTFICPANLVAVKGHRYLIEACRILLHKDLRFRCILAGDGPLEEDLRKRVREHHLEEAVVFAGRQPQEALFGMYRSGGIHAAVLPSIVTDDNEKEGIPVSLMEAMSYGIPVVSTNTGGIPELIGDGSGIIVREKDAVAIAREIEKLMGDAHYRLSVGKRGKERIQQEFSITRISEKLASQFCSV